MRTKASPPTGGERAKDRPLPNRRDILAAATAALTSAAIGSPAQAEVGAEGYFLVFDRPGNPHEDHLDRLFFIPSAWLELFELTDIYKALYPSSSPTTGWREALRRIRTTNAPDRKFKISALYSDSVDSGAFEPFPDATVIPPVPPGGNQTYLAQMVAPTNLPT